MPRRIEFEGRVHELPDDATDDEVRSVLSFSPVQSRQQESPSIGGGPVSRLMKAGVVEPISNALDATGSLLGMHRQSMDESVTKDIPVVGGFEAAARTGVKLGKGLVGSYQQQRERAAQLSAEGKHELAGLHDIPLVGPAIASPLERAGRGDVAGAIGETASLAGPATIGKAVSRALPGALGRSAARSQMRALAPGIPEVPLAERAAPELAKRGTVALTHGAYMRGVADELSHFGKKLDEAFDTLPPGKGAEYERIASAIDENVKRGFESEVFNPRALPGADPKSFPVGVGASNVVALTAQIKNYLLGFSYLDEATGARIVPYKNLRDMRANWDKFVEKAGGFVGKDLDTKVSDAAHEAAANGVRKIINGDNPNIEAINREVSHWSNVRDLLRSKDVRMKAASAPSPGEKLIAAGASSSQLGVYGANVGLLHRAWSSPAWNTVSARVKTGLADVIAAGDPVAINTYLTTQVLNKLPVERDQVRSQVEELRGRHGQNWDSALAEVNRHYRDNPPLWKGVRQGIVEERRQSKAAPSAPREANIDAVGPLASGLLRTLREAGNNYQPLLKTWRKLKLVPNDILDALERESGVY